jgi:hypothetical protein
MLPVGTRVRVTTDPDFQLLEGEIVGQGLLETGEIYYRVRVIAVGDRCPVRPGDVPLLLEKQIKVIP